MKKVVMILVLTLALALTFSIAPSFADGDLLNLDFAEGGLDGGDQWNIINGKFAAPRQCPDAGQYDYEAKDEDGVRVYPTVEVVNTDDGAAYRFAVDAVQGLVCFGNFFGIGDVVEAGKTYTAKIVYQFSGNDQATNVLGYTNTAAWENASLVSTELAVTDTWTEATVTFTVADGDASPALVIGPNGFCGTGSNAAAGYELLLLSLELYEGGNETPDTGDVGFAAVIVLSVALLAVVVIKKKAFAA